MNDEHLSLDLGLEMILLVPMVLVLAQANNVCVEAVEVVVGHGGIMVSEHLER